MPESVRTLTLRIAEHRLLLMLHGLLLFEAGLAILLFGGPASAANYLGEYSHVWLGVAALLPGAVLVSGANGSDQSRSTWLRRVVGLAGVAIWEIVVAALFARSALDASQTLLFLDPSSDPGTGRLYVPLVYLNIGLLAGTHLVTLLRLGPPKRPGTMDA